MWGQVRIAEPPFSAEPQIEGDYCDNCIYAVRSVLANYPIADIDPDA